MPLAGLSGLRSRWVLPPPFPDSVAARYPRAVRPVLHALYTRGILDDSPSSACRLQEFMSLTAPAVDPFRLRDMDRAVDRILAEIDRGAPIGVFGHYDCDGVTATALLCDALAGVGATAIPHIPGREDEYGIPVSGLERLSARGVKLVVTVDCGIRAHGHVDRAAAMGMEVIITDHHHCDRDESAGRDLLPAALAVINPKREDCSYPYKYLAGVGVAYRLAAALAQARPGSALADGGLQNLLDLVCVGTIADVMDLTGENRSLVAEGLRVLRELRRPGLRALLNAAHLAPAQISARNIAFVAAPRINAAQRLRHGKLSLQLLQAATCEEASPIARELDQLNRARREMTNEAVARACESLADRSDRRSILVAAGSWSSGISGLVASQIRETFGKPALAISAPSECGDHCVGSARSLPGFDITAALGAVRGRLVRFGGHTGAAGFTVLRSEIDALEEDLHRYTSVTLSPELVGPRLLVDGEMTRTDLRTALREQVARFEPCGQGNPAPLFLLSGASVVRGSLRVYTDDGMSCQLSGPEGPVYVSARGADISGALSGGPVDLVCQVTVDGNRPGLSLKAVDVRPAFGLPRADTTSE